MICRQSTCTSIDNVDDADNDDDVDGDVDDGVEDAQLALSEPWRFRKIVKFFLSHIGVDPY